MRLIFTTFELIFFLPRFVGSAGKVLDLADKFLQKKLTHESAAKEPGHRILLHLLEKYDSG